MAEALITHGIALARLKQSERAQFTFQKAIEVAHQAGALNRAGLAALTMIEEMELPPEILSAAYEQAEEWLTTSQSPDIELRFERAGKKLALQGIQKSKGTAEVLFNKQYRLPDEVLKFERTLIKNTLANVSGSITSAAKLMGVSHQRLAYILETRHKDLLKERSPVRRRPRKGCKTLKSPRSSRKNDSGGAIFIPRNSFTPSSDPQASPATGLLVPLIA